jgi:hypothetical protein
VQVAGAVSEPGTQRCRAFARRAERVVGSRDDRPVACAIGTEMGQLRGSVYGLSTRDCRIACRCLRLVSLRSARTGRSVGCETFDRTRPIVHNRGCFRQTRDSRWPRIESAGKQDDDYACSRGKFARTAGGSPPNVSRQPAYCGTVAEVMEATSSAVIPAACSAYLVLAAEGRSSSDPVHCSERYRRAAKGDFVCSGS